jgi:hypothetical protein
MDQVEEDLKRMKITGWRIDKSGVELLKRPRPTQGCRVNRRRRRTTTRRTRRRRRRGVKLVTDVTQSRADKLSS